MKRESEKATWYDKVSQLCDANPVFLHEVVLSVGFILESIFGLMSVTQNDTIYDYCFLGVDVALLFYILVLLFYVGWVYAGDLQFQLALEKAKEDEEGEEKRRWEELQTKQREAEMERLNEAPTGVVAEENLMGGLSRRANQTNQTNQNNNPEAENDLKNSLDNSQSSVIQDTPSVSEVYDDEESHQEENVTFHQRSGDGGVIIVTQVSIQEGLYVISPLKEQKGE